MKPLQLYIHTLTPALQLPVIFASDAATDHLAAYAPPNPRASCDTVRLLAKLDGIVVERLRAGNFEAKGAK